MSSCEKFYPKMVLTFKEVSLKLGRIICYIEISQHNANFSSNGTHPSSSSFAIYIFSIFSWVRFFLGGGGVWLSGQGN